MKIETPLTASDGSHMQNKEFNFQRFHLQEGALTQPFSRDEVRHT